MGGQAGEPVFVNKRLKPVCAEARHEDVDAEVKLVPVHEEGVGEVPEGGELVGELVTV